MIRIVLLDSKVRNGERVKGSATYEGSKAPRKFEVACRYTVQGRGRSHEEYVDSAETEGTSLSFDFQVPRQGPLSYDGQLLSIAWDVVASADLPMARDEREAVPFTVVPRTWDPAEWAEEEDEEDDENLDDEEESDEEP